MHIRDKATASLQKVKDLLANSCSRVAPNERRRIIKSLPYVSPTLPPLADFYALQEPFYGHQNPVSGVGTLGVSFCFCSSIKATPCEMRDIKSAL